MIAVSIIDALDIVLKLLGRDNLHTLSVQRFVRAYLHTVIAYTLHLAMNGCAFTIYKRKGVVHAIFYAIRRFLYVFTIILYTFIRIWYVFTIGLTLLLGLHGTSHIGGIHTTLYILHAHGHDILAVNSHVDSSIPIVNKSLLVGNKRHFRLFSILVSQRIGVTFIERHHTVHVVCCGL